MENKLEFCQCKGELVEHQAMTMNGDTGMCVVLVEDE